MGLQKLILWMKTCCCCLQYSELVHGKDDGCLHLSHCHCIGRSHCPDWNLLEDAVDVRSLRDRFPHKLDAQVFVIEMQHALHLVLAEGLCLYFGRSMQLAGSLWGTK